MMLIKVPGKSVRFIEISLFKGPFIFYEVGGVGFGGKGGHAKKNGGKGGVTRNILVHVELTRCVIIK